MVDPETIRQSVQARLDTALEAELAGIDVERVAELGDPAETIIKFAHEHSVDMIMIPTHGHSAFRNMVLGSVTAKVLSDAHCAVWTSTHTEQAPFKEQALTRRVLCAVDADEKAVPLLAWAEGYAKQWGASLKVVHATPESSPEHEDCMHSKYVAAIEKLATMAGADVPVLLATGIPSDVICGEAARQNSDLIIIGRGPEGKSDRLKTNHAIIRQATCPVISV
jgi:nucleotide-binding universal stress UspA family protein